MPRGLFLLLALCALAALLSCSPPRSDAEKLAKVYAMYEDFRPDFPGVEDLAPAEAMRLAARGRVVFVDARPENERAVSVLPGAVSDAFLADPGRFAGLTAIAYCTIGYRSGRLAERLAGQGVRVYNLRGGILAWTLEGGKIHGPDGREIRRIHVYGRTWNLPPAGYEAVF